MENPFNKMKNDEFLYQTCAMMGKENFIRFVDIAGHCCPSGVCAIKDGNYGNCFYEYLKEYEKNRSTIEGN